jgi:anthranilate phosphoribosyltransferase
MITLQQALARVVERQDLTQEESCAVMDQIMSGLATPAQIGAWLVALRMKGETVDEISGAVTAMRAKAVRVTCAPDAGPLLDTCGTGGDGAGTFNISTTAAFVAAACGVRVAKHGNRAISSRSGSADLLAALGVTLDASPEVITHCLEHTGIAFLFAPLHHGAMMHARGPRQELGMRTIFNLLGPMTNPAQASCQLLGLFDGKWLLPVAQVLGRLGSQRALVVHGADGLDEMTTVAETHVAELHADGTITTYTVTPEQFGLARAQAGDLAGGSVEENCAILYRVLDNTPGPQRDIVVLNAGAAIYVAGRAGSIADGMAMAAAAIADGRARQKVRDLARCSGAVVSAGQGAA